MTEINKDYIPLAELESEKFSFVATLPNFVNQHSIGINLNKINLLCRLGGINHIRVEDQIDEEISSFVPTMIGFDIQGNAYAAKAGMRTSTPTYTIDSQSENNELFPQSWTNGVIKVNFNETANRILGEKKWINGVSSPDAWSYQLNKIIKNGIVDIGTKHLILGGNIFDYLVDFMIVSSIMIRDFSQRENPLVGYGIWYLWCNIYPYVINRNPDGWRQSLLLTGPEIDRAILLKLTSLTSTLVKSIPDSTLKA